jgi:rhodanese-related sulfurtransferase
MKKIIIMLLVVFLLCGCTKTLPKPELSEGLRGELGIDKNINEETIDKYLNREDSVYRDMRMLEDPGNYAAIGGDSYLSGFVKGFEVVPYPYLTEVKGLPEEVGNSYQGRVLFTEQENGTYKANYKESLEILEYYFPKDKNIFLMCGGGGYAGMTKSLLVSLGWDADKIYNTGGYWFYNGKNNVEVKNTKDGETKYDFWKVTYHDIDFDSLTEVSSEN